MDSQPDEVASRDATGVWRIKCDITNPNLPALEVWGRGPALEGEGDMVLDLSQVHMVDSSGIGLMLVLVRGARAKGGKLVLRGANELIRNVLKLTAMDRLLVIEP
ncbi:MAG: STAS domain-containing protein [Candidatus Sumerlaeota bacterium]|nr:STAS domain-containing protein [Candidatus Sumerlaeota bacterium]